LAKKVAPKGIFPGQGAFFEAIFFKPSTRENGTRRSKGVFEAIFCLFEAIFSILQMALNAKKWLRLLKVNRG
jgi:hypothetical protein